VVLVDIIIIIITIKRVGGFFFDTKEEEKKQINIKRTGSLFDMQRVLQKRWAEPCKPIVKHLHRVILNLPY
jgi:hypothetical protein